MKTRVSASLKLALALLALCSVGTSWSAITILFDYSYDRAGTDFFGADADQNPTAAANSRIEALNMAAAFWTNEIEDDLSAISPSGLNTWDATFTNPDDGTSEAVTDLSVAADTIIIYVGAQSFSGSTLAEGETGGFTASGNAAWLATVEARGETGGLAADNPTSDYGPWGGSISFDIDAGGAAGGWNDDFDGTVGGTQYDLYSVAIHEIAHVLGFGTSQSWTELVDSANDEFDGTDAQAANGGSPVPLATDEAHHDGSGSLGTLMDTSLALGAREATISDVELAMMRDIGWIIPEPETYGAMFSVLLVAGFLARRRFLKGRKKA